MKKKIILITISAVVAYLAVWGFLEGRKERALEAEREKPIQEGASHLVAQPEGMNIILDDKTRQRAGVVISSIQTLSRQDETEVLAIVLSPQELIDLRNTYVAASAQQERTQSVLQASRQEYQRIKMLYGDQFNASTKSLEAAQMQWQIAEADASAATEALETVKRNAGSKWGNTIMEAMIKNTALFRQLAAGHEVLIRVAAPVGSNLTQAPIHAIVTANDGEFRHITLISPSPVVDPRIQGLTFFYTAPAKGLLPGTTITAHLPFGGKRNGSIIPSNSVVWWQGKAWYYIQSQPNHFVRRELLNAQAVDQGWFIVGLPTLQVVVCGAQTLLSEELRSQIQVGEEE